MFNRKKWSKFQFFLEIFQNMWSSWSRFEHFKFSSKSNLELFWKCSSNLNISFRLFTRKQEFFEWNSTKRDSMITLILKFSNFSKFVTSFSKNRTFCLDFYENNYVNNRFLEIWLSMFDFWKFPRNLLLGFNDQNETQETEIGFSLEISRKMF